MISCLGDGLCRLEVSVGSRGRFMFRPRVTMGGGFW